MIIVQSTNRCAFKPHYNFYPYGRPLADNRGSNRYREWVLGDRLYRAWSRNWDQIRAKYL